MNLGNATTFIQFDEDSKSLVINQGSTSEEMLATYMITLRLKDSIDVYSEQTYVMSVTIYENEIPIVETIEE